MGNFIIWMLGHPLVKMNIGNGVGKGDPVSIVTHPLGRFKSGTLPPLLLLRTPIRDRLTNYDFEYYPSILRIPSINAPSQNHRHKGWGKLIAQCPGHTLGIAGGSFIYTCYGRILFTSIV